MFGAGRIGSASSLPLGTPLNLNMTRSVDPYLGSACGTKGVLTWTAGPGVTVTSYTITWAARDGTTGAGNSGSVTGVTSTPYTFANNSFVYSKDYLITVTQIWSTGSASATTVMPKQDRVWVQYLLIGGGGGGGNFLGGGGGGGGFVDSTDRGNASFPLMGSIYADGTNRIYMGAGGGSNSEGGATYIWVRSDGSGDEWYRLTAQRGGLGGRANNGPSGGYSATGGGSGGGGSGGSGRYTAGPGTYPGSTYLSDTRQGYDGGVGNGQDGGSKASAGGGGGAGGVGGNASIPAGQSLYLQPGAGGAGKASSITGTAVTHAGGGGGGGDNQVGYSAAGGSGGGGTGYTNNVGGNATGGPDSSWTASYGGGGGGCGAVPYTTGGSGYKGAIYIAYPNHYPALSYFNTATEGTHYIYSSTQRPGWHLYKFYANRGAEDQFIIGWNPGI